MRGFFHDNGGYDVDARRDGVFDACGSSALGGVDGQVLHWDGSVVLTRN